MREKVKSKKAKVKNVFVMWSLLVLFLMSQMNIVSVLGQTETPPAPSAPRPSAIPKPLEKKLANGMRVIVVERPNVPLVTTELIIKSGGEKDPEELWGLANMTANLLTKGTKTRTAPQIAEQIEALGGSISSNSGWDSSSVSVSVLSNKFAEALTVAADVVRNPSFKDDEIERLKEQTLDEIKFGMSDPTTIARAVTARVVFGEDESGGKNYAHPLSGTVESVERIKRKDIVLMHDVFYRPLNVVLVIAGDIKAIQAFSLAKKLFGTWKNKPEPKRQVVAETIVGTTGNDGRSGKNEVKKVIVIDMPNAGQSAVTIAGLSIDRHRKGLIIGEVTNSILGGGYSSRLNQEIRIKRGLSYGAGSAIDARDDGGIFIARTQTKNQSAAVVADLLVSELNRLGEEPIQEKELTPRKAVLIGDFGRELETNAGLVGQIGELALYDLSLNEINTYIKNVQGVKESEVRLFAKTFLNPKNSSIIIVGDAKFFLEELRKNFNNVEVIPVDELDLNSDSLRKAKTNAVK